LEAAKETSINAPITRPLATIGNTLYGVVAGNNADIVMTFDLSTLKAGKEMYLDGRVIWGPQRAGNVVLLVSDSEGLMCFEDGVKPKWAVPMEYGAFAGPPLIDGQDFLFASVSGTVWRVASDSGAKIGLTDVGEPLATGPVGLGTRLLLSGTDGTVHVIPAPTAAPGSTGN
jgi:hypothetical protein